MTFAAAATPSAMRCLHWRLRDQRCDVTLAARPTFWMSMGIDATDLQVEAERWASSLGAGDVIAYDSGRQASVDRSGAGTPRGVCAAVRADRQATASSSPAA
jgi:hypothetical protein